MYMHFTLFLDNFKQLIVFFYINFKAIKRNIPTIKISFVNVNMKLNFKYSYHKNI